MHVVKIVQQLLKSTIHKSRIKSLLPALTAVISTKKLVLTELGRSLSIKGKERAGIRRIDRLLANTYYQQNAIVFYQCITKLIIGNKLRPIIIVDWSSIPNSNLTAEQGEHCVLRAVLSSEGRGLVLYEEVSPKSSEGNPSVHRHFLEKLKLLLPDSCCPCLLTDSGFKNPWFKAVQDLGWDYVGRTRGLTTYDEGQGFQSIKGLFGLARPTPKYLAVIG